MHDLWAVHRHLATELDSRLALLRNAPATVTLIGADADISHQLLATRYPDARFHEYDEHSAQLHHAAIQRKPKLLDKWRGKTVGQTCQNLNEPLPENSADMLFSNLKLHQAPDAANILQNWSNHLKPDGLLFFSCLGGNSLPEIRSLLTEHGITCAASNLRDMHDWGDMLLQGFNDPITDTARVQLAYERFADMQQDMQHLKLWQALQPDRLPEAERLLHIAWKQGKLSRITLETVFGHAIKKIRQPENTRPIHFYR